MEKDKFEELILKSVPAKIEPSRDFEAGFWHKVNAREKEPAIIRIWENLGSLIPTPSFAQAAAMLLLALLIGGGAGVVSAMNIPVPAPTLSGFQEIKGVPTASISGTYLKLMDEGQWK